MKIRYTAVSILLFVILQVDNTQVIFIDFTLKFHVVHFI